MSEKRSKSFRVPGLIGVGVSLGIAGAAYGVSRWAATSEYDNLREKWTNDRSLDPLIMLKR